MNSVLLIALLAVTHGYATADSEDLPESVFKIPENNTVNGHVVLGSKIDTNDRLLANLFHRVDKSYQIAHKQEIFIRLVEYARITRVEAWPRGPSSDSVLTVIDGGLGQNYVKVGYTTEKDKDFDYLINVYGVLVCEQSKEF